MRPPWTPDVALERRKRYLIEDGTDLDPDEDKDDILFNIT
jgi:hypothetical protein